MRVFVSTFKKYNNGDLTGAWLDLSDYGDHDDFITGCLNLHDDEEDPELMFQDWEEIPSGLVGECDVDAAVWDLLEAYEQFDRDAVNVYIGWMGSWDQSDFEDKYCGCYSSFRDYAEELWDECYAHEIPSHLQSYFDIDAFARDLGYDYHEEDGHIFRNC
ncbi:antirestriction protein [Oceanisphaera litoralis]|uniref:antirestriction protein ArdA n=1 Tax=Oceanisphaera litoralis TaxID=225144 RepID=UPI001958358B|nr:antirestriction protein ArdA [Oceanisphaera litoralis]MBM7454509.1 antirestriction protein [Oceanisphaera litoralis]